MLVPNAIQFLLLGGILGFFGQGARAVVGLATLSNFSGNPNPGESDVFNAARLIVSLIIGFLAGIAAALAFLAANNGNANPTLSIDTLIQFAGAGYIGVDVIEAFIVKYFDKSSSNSVVNQSGRVSMTDFAASLQTFAQIQKQIAVRPQLSSQDVIAFLKRFYPPADPRKWKITDPIPTVDVGEADAILDEISDLFASRGINYRLTLADNNKLKTTSYAAFAASIGQLFAAHGGTYVA